MKNQFEKGDRIQNPGPSAHINLLAVTSDDGLKTRLLHDAKFSETSAAPPTTR